MAAAFVDRQLQNNSTLSQPLYADMASNINTYTPFGLSNTQAQSNDMSFPGMENEYGHDFGFAGLLSDSENLFANNGQPTHVNPASMWSFPHKPGPAADASANTQVPGLDQVLDNKSGTVSEQFGQITPPDEHVSDQFAKPPRKRSTLDSGYGTMLESDMTMSGMGDRKQSSSGPSKRARKDSRISPVESEDMGFEGDDRREKYREKNRVAAAKCRAKKKEHVDLLEENHRTQSVLNAALKSTEKGLRDELSFWRTQALQHTFCNCRPIQEYNLRKAQNLAAEGGFGSNSSIGAHRHERSPTMSSVAASPVQGTNSQRSYRAQSAASHPSTSPAVTQAHASVSTTASSGTRLLSNQAEQELKDFFNDDMDS
ncbi:hypothetical protein H2203_008798 [Taxawa tesnikishii (nom. ined.)]|nr:hypothetical protein H2203_008798 [Dothideales sp. JES 119]